MESFTGENPGLLRSLKRLGRTVLGVAENRLELLLVELQEERWRVVEALLLVASVAVLSLMTLIVGTFALVMYFPPERRVLVLSAASLFYLLATLGIYLRLRNRLDSWRSFSSSLAELKKDMACLEGKK